MPHQKAMAYATCPLCQLTQGQQFYLDERDYYRCGNCGLVFVLPEHFLTAEEEKSRYDYHENNPADPAYRRFLSRIFIPVSERIAPNSSGLDFGSGPGPTLSLMLGEVGHNMAIYDPFYAPDEGVFEKRYDFITTSEVAEHLHHPRQELARLWQCIRPAGLLAIMTKRVSTLIPFNSWHYKDDPTHVIFFADETFRWLATHWHAELEIVDKDVVIFHKSE